jgi:hypothetical protein
MPDTINREMVCIARASTPLAAAPLSEIVLDLEQQGEAAADGRKQLAGAARAVDLKAQLTLAAEIVADGYRTHLTI